MVSRPTKFENSGHIWCGVFEGTQNQIKLFANVIVHLISTISLLSTLVTNGLSQMFFNCIRMYFAIVVIHNLLSNCKSARGVNEKYSRHFLWFWFKSIPDTEYNTNFFVHFSCISTSIGFNDDLIFMLLCMYNCTPHTYSLFVTHATIKFSVSLVIKFEIRTYSFCFKSYSRNR